MERLKQITIISFLSIMLFSCQEKERSYHIDEKSINRQDTIVRFDKDVYQINTNDMQHEMLRLNGKYSYFFPYYTQGVLGIGSPETIEAAAEMERFLTDTGYHKLYTDALEKYKDVKSIENKITTAYKYMQYYFPSKHLPEIYMHVSGFNQSIVVTDRVVSASIDNYMGSDYDLYNYVTYDYQRKFMIPEKLPSDLLYVWLYSEFYDDNIQLSALLNEMIYTGKVMYLLSVIMPTEEDAMLIGFTKEQYRWCEQNEAMMWTYIVENKHLFSTDVKLVSKYMSEAPFTTYFPRESPGRSGIWLGWQIVKSYMNRNQSITLQALMNNRNYQQILEDSGYRP